MPRKFTHRAVRASPKTGQRGGVTFIDQKRVLRQLQRETTADLAEKEKLIAEREAQIAKLPPAPPKTRAAYEALRRAVQDGQVVVVDDVTRQPLGFNPVPPLRAAGVPAATPEILIPAQYLQTSNKFFVPTEEQRVLVRDMALWFVPMKDMVQRIIDPATGRPITETLLKNAFRQELDEGMAEGNATLAKNAYLGAIGVPAQFDENGNQIRAERPPNPALTIWGTKIRLGWRESKNVDINHATVDSEANAILKELTEDELRALREMARRRAVQSASENKQIGGQSIKREET